MYYKQPGRELSEDLARKIENEHWMAWTNMPLGSVLWSKPGIVDVIAIYKSYSTRAVRIYEVKMNRSDFNADVNTGKFLKYLEHCTQFFFAVPSGLISKEEVPDTAGLIVRGPNTWKVVKTAPRRESELSNEVLLALLMKGYEEHCQTYRPLRQKEEFLNYVSLRKAASDFGFKVSAEMSEAKELLEGAEEMKNKLSETLGVSFSSIFDPITRLRHEVERLLAKRQYLEEAIVLADLTMELFQGRSWDLCRRLREIADKLDK